VWPDDQAGDAGPGGLRATSLTWVRGAQACCPGDKMIDWVPPFGGAAAQSNQAARLAFCARAKAGSG